MTAEEGSRHVKEPHEALLGEPCCISIMEATFLVLVRFVPFRGIIIITMEKIGRENTYLALCIRPNCLKIYSDLIWRFEIKMQFSLSMPCQWHLKVEKTRRRDKCDFISIYPECAIMQVNASESHPPHLFHFIQVEEKCMRACLCQFQTPSTWTSGLDSCEKIIFFLFFPVAISHSGFRSHASHHLISIFYGVKANPKLYEPYSLGENISLALVCLLCCDLLIITIFFWFIFWNWIVSSICLYFRAFRRRPWSWSWFGW